MKREIFVISNDKIFFEKKNIYLPNNNLNTFLRPLSKIFKINLLCRKSKIKEKFKFNLKKINIYNNFSIFKKNKKNKINLLILTVTPYNFFVFFICKFLFGKNVSGKLVILSDGYKEYQHKLSYIGYIFYHLMFSYMKKNLKVISVSKYFTNLKVDKIISPTTIDNKWYLNIKKAKLDKIRFLYVGRFKREKGIYSLLKLLKYAPNKFNFHLKAVGLNKNLDLKSNNNFSFIKEFNSTKRMKSLYDWCNIFVLPSYTEGNPRVIFESLSRQRPIILFEDIAFLSKNNEGVFVSKRNFKSFKNKVNFILKNYSNIQNLIKKNKKINSSSFNQSFLKYFN